MNKYTIALGFFAILSVCSFTQRSGAFTLVLGPANQITTGWSGGTVTFDIDASCASYITQVHGAIDTASRTWGAVPTSGLKVASGATVTLPQPITTYVGGSASAYAPVGNTIIYCDANFGADAGVDANSIPGFAGAQNISSSGELVGGLLVLNVQSGASANINALDSTLLGVVLTHEIGHSLGIGHSADPNALMYYASGPGRKVVLAKDDIDAVTYLYPKQEVGKNMLGCGSISELNRRMGSGGGVSQFLKTVGPELMLLILFLVFIRIYGRMKIARHSYAY